jgi:hypothetical protein
VIQAPTVDAELLGSPVGADPAGKLESFSGERRVSHQGRTEAATALGFLTDLATLPWCGPAEDPVVAIGRAGKRIY